MIIIRKIIKDEKGFSMIELMIALTLLLTGLLAVAQMQIAAIQGNSTANRLSMASTVGTDRLEKLIRASNSHTDLLDGDHADPDNPVNGYDIFWTVTSSADPAFKNIKLTVKWSERGQPKKMVFDYVKPGS